MDSNSEWPKAGPETVSLAVGQQLPGPKDPSADPPWSGWDVTRIGLLLFVLPFLVIPFVALAAKKIFYPGLPWLTVAQKPWIALTTQFFWYAAVAVYMIMFVEGTFHRRFWEAIHWNWPRRTWALLVPIGMVMVSLQGLEHFFKIPKHIPMEEFLATPLAAAMTAILAVTLGPLMEELFFRGFLYPVLARRFGVTAGVVATAVEDEFGGLKLCGACCLQLDDRDDGTDRGATWRQGCEVRGSYQPSAFSLWHLVVDVRSGSSQGRSRD